jgi:hypothetical protein
MDGTLRVLDDAFDLRPGFNFVGDVSELGFSSFWGSVHWQSVKCWMMTVSGILEPGLHQPSCLELTSDMILG